MFSFCFFYIDFHSGVASLHSHNSVLAHPLVPVLTGMLPLDCHSDCREMGSQCNFYYTSLKASGGEHSISAQNPHFLLGPVVRRPDGWFRLVLGS